MSKRVSPNYKPSRVRSARSLVCTLWRSPLHGWVTLMPAMVRTPFTWVSGRLETGLALRPTVHLTSMTTSHGSESASWTAFPSRMATWRHWFVLCRRLTRRLVATRHAVGHEVTGQEAFPTEHIGRLPRPRLSVRRVNRQGDPPYHRRTRNARNVFHRLGRPSPSSSGKWTSPGWV